MLLALLPVQLPVLLKHRATHYITGHTFWWLIGCRRLSFVSSSWITSWLKAWSSECVGSTNVNKHSQTLKGLRLKHLHWFYSPCCVKCQDSCKCHFTTHYRVKWVFIMSVVARGELKCSTKLQNFGLHQFTAVLPFTCRVKFGLNALSHISIESNLSLGKLPPLIILAKSRFRCKYASDCGEN